MNTIVVCTVHREPKVKKWLGEHESIKYSYTGDYTGFPGGQYRCWMGHITGLAAYMTDDTAIVFEDDCVVDDERNWMQAIVVAQKLVDQKKFDVVSLHCRGLDMAELGWITHHESGFTFRHPPQKQHYVLNGTLAYVINKKAAWEFRNMDPFVSYNPIDLTLWSREFNYCILENTPFIHGAGHKESILENPKNMQYGFV